MISYTINTDASYSNKYRRGAYAFWIRGDNNFHVKGSGMFPRQTRLPNSSIAELLAFEKAIKELNKHVPEEWRSATLLYINTDSQWVINALEGTIKTSKHLLLISAVRHITKGYKLDCRHVKAHTGDLTEKRSWINDWCDKEAKRRMGEELY